MRVWTALEYQNGISRCLWLFKVINKLWKLVIIAIFCNLIPLKMKIINKIFIGAFVDSFF
jgi:hypothetical protein